MKVFLFNQKLSFLHRSFCFLFLVSSFLNTFVCATQHLCHFDQRDALLDFKKEFGIQKPTFVNFDVSSYPKTKSWVNKSDCCSWDGITCDATSGTVIGLDLSSSCMHGQLESNSSLFRLRHLRDLNLAYNNFTASPILADFDKLMGLERLNLSHSSFSGPAPTKLLQLTKLVSLDLSYSSFSIDESFLRLLAQNLRNLRELDMSWVNISSEIPRCNITEFPEFIKYRRSLGSLDLSNNKIKGQVPDWLWRLPKLTDVNLSNNALRGYNGSFKASPQSQILSNNFTGEIPRSICGLSSLYVLDLSDNNLHGSIPWCIETQMISLVDLNLRHNRLSGNLPEVFMNAKNLGSLDVSHNQMEGKLPASLSGCSALEVLNVGSNRINDMFPFQLNSLQNLQVLVLRSNKFHGTLHNVVGVSFGFPQLKIIDVSHNEFVGTLPSDYFMNWTLMSSKRDNNREPEYIRNPRTYRYYTSLILTSKEVSMEMDRILTIYTSIDFSGNQLHGKIPDSIGLLKELRNLNMSSNSFTGHIPSSLANLTNLESLDLSQNKISGEIPFELGTLSSLEWINVSHNQLVGSIPQGTQFQRQKCSSYEGNPGLYGPSLKDVCGDIKAPTPPQSEPLETQEEEEESLSWIAAGLGFAPGVVFGLAMGYIASYKYQWFMKTFG
ncbi:unnamed protein product [Arabidopsis lyrata]|nr:unnamed protein product [Arabidopsis lyrata]